MAQNDNEHGHKPTCNGILKGRPGKGSVLSLEQRKRCYVGHPMTEDNTFRYKAITKRDKNGKAIQFAPVRAWCKKCRVLSRKRSVAKRLELARAEVKAKEQRNAKARERSAAKREQAVA